MNLRFARATETSRITKDCLLHAELRERENCLTIGYFVENKTKKFEDLRFPWLFLTNYNNLLLRISARGRRKRKRFENDLGRS